MVIKIDEKKLTHSPWEDYNTWQDRWVNRLDIIVPMPDFSLREPNEHEQINPAIPHLIAKSIRERFPALKDMPTEHPAFKVVLAAIPEHMKQLNPTDWDWHKRARRKARDRDQLERFMKRRDIENFLQSEHIKDQLAIIDRIREHFFTTVLENKINFRWYIQRQKDKALESQLRFQKRGLELLDAEKRRQFFNLYFKEFSPNAVATESYLEKKRNNPSLSQVTMKKDAAITPFEYLIKIAAQMFPLIRKEQIAELFSEQRERINRARILSDDQLAFKKKVTKMFHQIFQINETKEMFEQRAEGKRFAAVQDFRQFQVDKKIAINANSHQLVEEHAVNLNKLHKQVNEIVDAYDFRIQKKLEFEDVQRRTSELYAARNVYTPISVEGKTELIQANPIRTRTQYKLVEQWVNAVEDLRNQQDIGMSMVRDQQLQNKSKSADIINKTSLERAVEAVKLREILRYRNFTQEYPLVQLMGMFAAQAQMANIATGYHTNRIPAAEINIEKNSIEEVKEIKSLKKVD